MSREKMYVTIKCECGNQETKTATDNGYGINDKWSDLATPKSFSVVRNKRASISDMPEFKSAICKECGKEANIDYTFKM